MRREHLIIAILVGTAFMAVPEAAYAKASDSEACGDCRVQRKDVAVRPLTEPTPARAKQKAKRRPILM